MVDVRRNLLGKEVGLCEAELGKEKTFNSHCLSRGLRILSTTLLINHFAFILL